MFFKLSLKFYQFLNAQILLLSDFPVPSTIILLFSAGPKKLDHPCAGID